MVSNLSDRMKEWILPVKTSSLKPRAVQYNEIVRDIFYTPLMLGREQC